MFWDDNTNIKGFFFLYSWQTSGISFAGHNTYGMFPMKGKLLNVREISHNKIMENAEINNNNCIFGP